MSQTTHEEEILQVACDMESTSARDAYLNQACGDDSALISKA